ncbi:MAG: WGR domain-containing protein [Pseudomonadota bacterium]|nr:WGR domain-containing protein [Pseudomonadota bacterium]
MVTFPTRLANYRVDLEAVDGARNIRRSYSITSARDLFGHMIVELHWGRIGGRGQGMAVSFSCPRAAERFVAQTLARRASAERRIGVGYRPVGSEA